MSQFTYKLDDYKVFRSFLETIVREQFQPKFTGVISVSCRKGFGKP